ncbi:MAG: lysine--tRNA ligase [Pseudomonadota bacterium]
MTEDTDLLATRRAKHQAWLEHVKVWPNDFRRTHLAEELHAAHTDADKAALEAAAVPVVVAGRVMLRRVMGKASFLTLRDVSGDLQCYLRKDALETVYAQFEDWCDIGDIVGIRGTLMRTNKGELTVAASEFRLLNKTLRPLPDKHHGLTDQERKYRARYLDLMVNDDARARFRQRSRMIQSIRNFFLERDFLEVETPMMHVIPGGATAKPFVTHHNALDLPLFMRVAPELHLKRLTVGGFERVFEMNRNFRNEGISTRHNPEYTSLEYYQAFADYNDAMDDLEALFAKLAHEVVGGEPVAVGDVAIDLTQPFERLSMKSSLARYENMDPSSLDDPAVLRARLTEAGVTVQNDWGSGRMIFELFEALVEDNLIQPTFITEYPAEVSPLSRRNDDNPDITDRFELFIGGREIANGFSELNDPDDQAERFWAQVAAKDAGDEEAMHFDADYIEALEYGLPPAVGVGIGIDRLVMLLTGAPSIRDVLLFPLMRPLEGRDDG